MSRIFVVPLASGDPPEHIIALDPQKSDKVYLIMERRLDALSYRRVRNWLELYHMEVKPVLLNNNQLLSYLEKFSDIFDAEQGRDIYVNLSTGNKITAVAGMIACMLWKGIPYYVRLGPKKTMNVFGDETPPVSYHPIYGVDFLPVFDTAKPSPDSLKVLSVISEAGDRISKKELIEKLQSPKYRMIPQYPPSSSKSAPHSRLHDILNPLEKHWRFVTTQARGRRSHVTLTEKGNVALRIFGGKNASR